MKYVKHRYSGRVYQVMTDHGPDCPYLSCFPHVRNPSAHLLQSYFTSTAGPVEDSTVSVSQELEWEQRQQIRKEPLVVKAPPEPPRRRKTGSKKDPKEGYTLKDLCSELGVSPATARKLLRSKGKSAPEGGWKWKNAEEASSIKKFLKKLL